MDHERDQGGGRAVNPTIAKAYVSEMLELNPMLQASQIMRRRRELWGVSAAVPVAVSMGNVVSAEARRADGSADKRLRDRAKKCLSVLQSDFYSLPDEKLQQYLRIIDSQRLPEYAAIAKRLRAVAKCRSVLINAIAETHDPKFAYSLQQSLVRPPAESGHWQEQYIMSIIAERRVPAAVDMVRRYRKAHPEIEELQRDWFDVLIDPANQKAWKGKYSFLSQTRETFGSAATISSGFILLMLIIVIRGAVTYSANTKPTNPTPTWNRPVPAAEQRVRTVPPQQLSQPQQPSQSPQPWRPPRVATPSPPDLTGEQDVLRRVREQFDAIRNETHRPAMPPHEVRMQWHQEQMNQFQRQHEETMRRLGVPPPPMMPGGMPGGDVFP